MAVERLELVRNFTNRKPVASKQITLCSDGAFGIECTAEPEAQRISESVGIDYHASRMEAASTGQRTVLGDRMLASELGVLHLQLAAEALPVDAHHASYWYLRGEQIHFVKSIRLRDESMQPSTANSTLRFAPAVMSPQLLARCVLQILPHGACHPSRRAGEDGICLRVLVRNRNRRRMEREST
ncbi:hypothetical protein Dda_1726 [Drechslerella dactyloides]|uniref:Uncharacterized protein n=1 Tax=Drechslerella dactyloides TaxID=74499 RepID=A0AAD6J2J7_DREDA|nr:hypothetical protein Dda_1726 [Drechslerella dactyloides]